MSSEFHDINNHRVHVEQTGSHALPTVVFLHGFTGSTISWHPVIKLLEGKVHAVSIDLWGHGRSETPKEILNYAMDQQVKDIEAVCKELQLESFLLVGYSMGGRIALAYASTYSKRIRGLLLESASPGLQKESERADRKMKDAQLAKRLQQEPICDFINFWQNIALFDSQKSMSVEKRAAVRRERLNQNPLGLANSLLGIGTGSQTSYWDLLVNQLYPVLLLTGKLDQKFEELAGQMKNSLPNVEHRSILQTGHAIHVEKPEEFATIVEDYIKQLN